MGGIAMPQGGSTAGDAFNSGVKSGIDLYHQKKQNELVDQETQKNKLANDLAQVTNDQKQAQLKALSDPNSLETKVTKNQASAYLEGLKGTGLFKGNETPLNDLISTIKDPNVSGLQVHQTFESSPIMKSLTGLGESQAKASVMIPIAQARMEGVANQKDRIAQQIGDHIDKDPTMIKINRQKQQIDLDKHTLETAPILTPQILSEIQKGMANAISGGGNSAQGTFNKMEIETVQQKMAEVQQRFSGSPTGVKDPELVDYFKGVLDRLGNAYDKNAYSRAQQIAKGRSKGLSHNPDAIQVLNDKVESYKPVDNLNIPAAKPPPNGHQTVQQNGHTFNWNGQTGQYE